jgi:protein-L-isoaspartate(D-aspartate) O-methyltransferase
MVATMIELLAVRQTDRVLEIGTGSGYQTAILARLAAHVFTVERHAALLEPAETRLAGLGLTNVTTLCGDGSEGWFEHAPYERIIVAAGAPRVPVLLRSQLDEGGRLVIPVGERHVQDLVLVERTAGQFFETKHGTCVFVPLLGQAGWGDDAP